MAIGGGYTPKHLAVERGCRHVIEVVVGGSRPELAQVQIEERIQQPTGGTREDRRIVKPVKPLLSMDTLEAEIREKNADDSIGQAVALKLLRGLQDRGFDSEPMRDEIRFGIRDETRPNRFISLLNLTGNYVRIPQVPNQKEDPVGVPAFRKRANQIFEFFDPTALDDVKRWSRQPKYARLDGLEDCLLGFVTEERDRLLQQMREQP